MADQTRQYAETIDGIRPDHVTRYRFAAKLLAPGVRVLDMACGCGYGSWIMHQAGLKVTGVDISQEAIDYAQRYYKGPTYLCQKAEDTEGSWDAITTFETVEHLANPEVIFRSVKAKLILASVPNQEKYGFSPERFKDDTYPHLRHYTPKEFDQFFADCGYRIIKRFCQPDKGGDIVKGTEGLFLIYLGANDN